MALTVRDLERAFTGKLGAERDNSGDHIYFNLHYECHEYTVGKLSHSWRGTLNDTQVVMLARKLFLQKREFERWVDCEISSAEMIGLWQSRRRDVN